MKDWEPLNHHNTIINKIKELNTPILTTNFEETLAKTFNYKLSRQVKMDLQIFILGQHTTEKNG